VIEQHESFQPPSDPNVPLWRYMDLAKFLNLIQTGKLYFPRADLLGDPFEGSMTFATVRAWEEALTNEETRSRVFPDMSADDARRMREQMARFYRDNVRESFVSCWHAAQHESAAMWSLYGRSGEAIAVQTTFEKLAREFPSDVLMGRVDYIDYECDFINISNLFNALMRKRRSFEHEKEIRAIVWARSGKLSGTRSADGRIEINENGATVQINLSAVFERVFVGPTAPSWFADVVRSVAEQYGLDVPVQQSSLAATPVF
jgi:hypothetical protein